MVLSSLEGGVLTSQECVRSQREFEAQSTKCDDRTPPPDVAAAAKAHPLVRALEDGLERERMATTKGRDRAPHLIGQTRRRGKEKGAQPQPHLPLSVARVAPGFRECAPLFSRLQIVAD